MNILVGVRLLELNGLTDKSEKPDPPSAHYLADQMSAHIKSGRFEDLADLRNEMLIAGARPDVWTTAQIKFYMDRQQYIIVLRQFAHFYSFVGVPKDVLLPYIQADLPDLHRKYAIIHPSLPIVSPPTHSRGINRWPSTHTLTMVWQSLVYLVRDLGTLQNLYRSFITYLDEHRPSTSSESQPIGAEDYTHMRFQYPPAMSPDTVHFHVFIMAFARIAGGDAAIKVISDMQARGIQPDVHNWTALAGHYAGQHDVDRAERILNRMESNLTDKQTAPARSSEVNLETRTREGPIHRKAGWIPEPSLVTYTTILRGLIDRGNYQDAKRIAMRMDEAGYVPGTDERADMVLQLSRDRESAPRVSWESRS